MEYYSTHPSRYFATKMLEILKEKTVLKIKKHKIVKKDNMHDLLIEKEKDNKK